MNSSKRYFPICLLATALVAGAFPALAQTAPDFAILAKDAVTCTNGTIAGSVGTFSATPVGSITQTSCPVVGQVDVGGSAAIQAYNAFLTQYTALAPKPTDVCPIITGTLAGQKLAPGTYCVSAEAKTGVLTLDGPANGVWTFKVAPGAFTGTNFTVVMAGQAQACNVTWWTDAATTMTDSDLKGTILSGAAATLTRGTLIGNTYAKANVTITGTAVVGCATQAGPGPNPGPGACSDRVTGGGYINAGRDKANFGVTAGVKHGALRGHLTYIDHGTDMKVNGTGVTAYVVANSNTRHIEGTATIDGVAGTYSVDVTDNGEPGRDDVFKIKLSSGYAASGKLAGGNIQLHKKDCSKDGKGDGDNDHDDDDQDDDDHDGDDHGEHKPTPQPYGKK